jgi:3-oxoadipate enol-lactonase
MTLHHEISGPGGAPVLLMGGSLGTTLEMWDGQLPLAERLRLVRFDHRGHGGSPRPSGPYEIADLGRDVLALLDRLGLECCGAIERMDLRDQLPRVAVPTLVISGADDPATPPDQQRLIAEAVPGARHEVVGSAAHIAPVEQPEAVNRLILEHVR